MGITEVNLEAMIEQAKREARSFKRQARGIESKYGTKHAIPTMVAGDLLQSISKILEAGKTKP